MLTLYTDSSPNGFKATIALEELGLPYTPQARPHQPGRTPPARLPAPEPAWPHPRPHRRRDRHHPVRIRRHPALPGRENRPPAARRTARPLASHAMAHLPRRQRRPADRPTRPLRNLRRPQRPHRHRTLPPPHARSLRNAGPAPGQRPAPFRRRRIQHRRHRPLRLDPYRPPHRLRLRRLPASERLARTHRPQTRRAARHHAPGARHRGMSRLTPEALARLPSRGMPADRG